MFTDWESGIPPVSYTHLDVYKRQVFLISRKYIQTIQKIAQGIHNYEGTDAKQINVCLLYTSP